MIDSFFTKNILILLTNVPKIAFPATEDVIC